MTQNEYCFSASCSSTAFAAVDLPLPERPLTNSDVSCGLKLTAASRSARPIGMAWRASL